jgi:hypothetical protein
MLHEIRIENFYSIRDEQIIDLRVPENAPKLARFREARSRKDTRLPTVVALFGPNASGKSTVLRAISSAVNFAVSSFDLGVEAPIPYFQPFMHVSCQCKPTKIEIEFDASWIDRDASDLYRYQLLIENSGEGSPKRVLHEALSYAPEGRMRRIFERESDRVFVGKEFGISPKDTRLKSIRPNCSVLSTLAKLNHEVSTTIWTDLSYIQTNVVGLDRWEIDEKTLLQFYAQNREKLQELNQELRRLDVGLREMTIYPNAAGLLAAFYHDGLDSPIFFQEESHGTRRFISIFPRINFVLAHGHIALIDEIDADLHPLIIPEIFNWFYDPNRNPYAGQIFVTAHNAILLDDLEKEEVFFTQKDSLGGTEVYGAKEIKGLRRDLSLMKKYLGGVLGAVPHVG